MSTYEFQLNAPQDQYQAHASHHGPPILTPASISTPGPSSTPGASSAPQPIIIQYDANQGKHPYGTGEHDEGFTLEFESLDAFNAWKAAEEENNCVDFFKVDSHSSKAVPPRFKEHTKLACTRHARAGQKKYVKKFPERQRKTPSKKLEGIGCPATICYKTYFDTSIVRVSYVSHHSHEIGEANLPFTKRFRRQKSKGAHNAHSSKDELAIKAISEEAFDRLHSDVPSTPSEPIQFSHQTAGPSLPPSPPASMQDPLDIHQMDPVPYPGLPRMNVPYEQSVSSHDTSSPIPHPPISPPHAQTQHMQRAQQHPHHIHMNSHDQNQIYNPPREHSAVAVHGPNRDGHNPMPTSVHNLPQTYHQFQRGMEPQQQHGHVQPPPRHQHQHQPPIQTQPQPHSAHHSLPQPPPSQPPSRPSLSQHGSNQSRPSISQHGSGHGPIGQHTPIPVLPDRRQLTQERWDRMESLFGHIRRQAVSFDFGDATVSALEMLLLRLYLETPSNQGGGPSPYPGQHPQDHQQGHGQNMMP